MDLATMTFEQFQERFSTEEACAEALYQARWPDGFRCPRCACSHAYFIRSRKHYECADCHYQVSLTAGTVLENTRTPLTKWFLAMFMMSRPNGISAIAFQRLANVTYKTAWTMLMKLRSAMNQADEDQPLTGNVQLTPIVYGRKIHLSSHLIAGEHRVFAGASCDENDDPVQLKIKLVPEKRLNGREFRRADSQFFQEYYVDPEAEVRCRLRMRKLPRHKELRALVYHTKQWVYRTYIAIGEKHLQRYFDEYCFRYNRGEAAYRLAVFSQLPDPIRFLAFARFNTIYPPEGYAVNAPSDGVAIESVFGAMIDLCVTTPALIYREMIRPRFPHHQAFLAYSYRTLTNIA